MTQIKKSLAFGFLVWLIPFAVSIPFFSREGEPIIDIVFIKTIMIVVGTLVGSIFLVNYFRSVEKSFIKEGWIVGGIWLAINWVLDFVVLVPMMDISGWTYFGQIGLRYLALLIVSVSMGRILNHKAQPKS